MMSTENQTPSTSPFQPPFPYGYIPPSVAEEEIKLLDLWRVLVREKWLILFLITLCTVGAIIAALITTPIYRAEVLMEPVSEDGGKGGGLSQFGGLAAMAGISLGGGGSSKDANIARMKSREFIEKFINDEKILPILFPKLWDSEAQKWKEDDPKKIPSMWRAVELFLGIFTITEDKKTGLITLAIEWKDRELATRWANLLVERINDHLRELVVQDYQKNMEFLNSEMSKTTIVEVKQAIVNILEGQIKKIMMAKVSKQYAFKVLDPAVVSPKDNYVKPKKRLMVILGFIMGSFLGIFAAFINNSLKKQKESVLTP
ncbi:MAG: Wzz/FepE/Etk N-terminal domain-containing protein [Magnetococcus sp. DMHC-6]